MKKIILATLLSVFGLSGVLAQNWTKEMQKDFRKQKEVAFAVDLSKALIMGVTADKFPAFYAGKYHSTEEYGKLTLDKIQNTIQSIFFDSVTKARYNPDAPYKVVYCLTNVTEKAGLKGYMYVVKDGDKSAEKNFKIKDGRWNDFDELLNENVGKLLKAYHGFTPTTPYIVNLYKY